MANVLRYRTVCNACDAEYSVSFFKKDLTDVMFCPFCGHEEAISEDDTEED